MVWNACSACGTIPRGRANFQLQLRPSASAPHASTLGGGAGKRPRRPKGTPAGLHTAAAPCIAPGHVAGRAGQAGRPQAPRDARGSGGRGRRPPPQARQPPRRPAFPGARRPSTHLCSANRPPIGQAELLAQEQLLASLPHGWGALVRVAGVRQPGSKRANRRPDAYNGRAWGWRLGQQLGLWCLRRSVPNPLAQLAGGAPSSRMQPRRPIRSNPSGSAQLAVLTVLAAAPRRPPLPARADPGLARPAETVRYALLGRAPGWASWSARYFAREAAHPAAVAGHPAALRRYSRPAGACMTVPSASLQAPPGCCPACAGV